MASSFSSFLADHAAVATWLVRALVTLMLAVAWHFLTAKKQPAGYQLQAETHHVSEVREKFLESLENSALKQQQQENRHIDESSENENASKADENRHIDESSETENASKAADENHEKALKEEDTTDTAVAEEDTAPAAISRPRPRTTARTRPRQAPQTPEPRPRMTATTNSHPGMAPFHRWYDIEASLYRIYVIGKTDGTTVVCPFVPKSERGNVSVDLEVTNNTSNPMDVFWIDYKGREVYKGSAAAFGGVWYQTTWIGHPWTFRNSKGQVLLNYIPHKIAPTTHEVSTVSANDPNVGRYQFSIERSSVNDEEKHYACSIVDPVFPTQFHTPTEAITWSLQHMSRYWPQVNGRVLLKYLVNILQHPSDYKYRQIRIANRVFSMEVWNTACRGVLLAAGFQERGGHAEWGCEQALSGEHVRELSALVMRIEHWLEQQEKGDSTLEQQQQPEGAVDGYGRAGFGRAGQMNL